MSMPGPWAAPKRPIRKCLALCMVRAACMLGACFIGVPAVSRSTPMAATPCTGVSKAQGEDLVNETDVHGITPVFLTLQRWVPGERTCRGPERKCGQRLCSAWPPSVCAKTSAWPVRVSMLCMNTVRARARLLANEVHPTLDAALQG
eukprot:364447-Chlamydomonas_euryale.AAC.32